MPEPITDSTVSEGLRRMETEIISRLSIIESKLDILSSAVMQAKAELEQEEEAGHGFGRRG